MVLMVQLHQHLSIVENLVEILHKRGLPFVYKFRRVMLFQIKFEIVYKVSFKKRDSCNWYLHYVVIPNKIQEVSH